MPIDALFLTALRSELEPRALGCRVDKVQQPARDTVLLSLRGAGGGGRLLLTASPNQPRIHFTELAQENPAQPPMFCMLLRKHLVGGKLAAIRQPRMERLVDLAFDCTDEMGSPVQKHLILEIMGRNSNLILTGGDGRILDCLRRVDFEMSAERQVLPGLYYHEPPRQAKQEIFAQTPESVRALLGTWPEGQPLDKWLLETFGDGAEDARSAAPRGAALGFFLHSHHAVRRRLGTLPGGELFAAARRVLRQARPTGSHPAKDAGAAQESDEPAQPDGAKAGKSAA